MRGGDQSEARDEVLQLLQTRGPGKSICPSEVARTLAGPDGDWRARMDEVHAAVDTMIASGRIAIGWRGDALSERAGPYRIRLP